MTEEEKGFYDLSDFPEFDELQENYEVIVEELKENKLWVDWGSDAYDDEGNCDFLKGDWKVCPIYFGNVSAEMMHVPELSYEEKKQLEKRLPSLFPQTTRMLQSIHGINYAAFTKLYPRSRLEPHRHRNPYILVYHLGLIIPPGETCGIRVGDQTHIWREGGEAIVFDDTLEHTAWNDSDMDRIVFYLSFAHPNPPKL